MLLFLFIYRVFALRLFPSRCDDGCCCCCFFVFFIVIVPPPLPVRPPATLFLDDEAKEEDEGANRLRSPLEMASPLLEKRFLPPNPNFSSRFCRLTFGFPRVNRTLF